MQTPKTDDVKSENPVWLDSEQISKYRSRGQMLVPQSRQSGHCTRRERVVPKNVRSFTRQLFQIEATRSVPEWGDEWIQVFEFGDVSSEVTVFSDSDRAGGQRNEEIVKRGESRCWDGHLLQAYTRKQKIIVRSSAEAELYAAALGASEAKGVQSMMCDLGFALKPGLIIDAKATEHILHRHGIGKMETHRRGAFGGCKMKSNRTG